MATEREQMLLIAMRADAKIWNKDARQADSIAPSESTVSRKRQAPRENSLAAHAARLGISRDALKGRIRKWGRERALSEPRRRKAA